MGFLFVLGAVAVFVVEPGSIPDHEQRAQKLARLDSGFKAAREINKKLRRQLEEASHSYPENISKPTKVTHCDKGFCSGVKTKYMGSSLLKEKHRVVVKSVCTDDLKTTDNGLEVELSRSLLGELCFDAPVQCQSGTYAVAMRHITFDSETSKRKSRKRFTLPPRFRKSKKKISDAVMNSPVFATLFCAKDPDQSRIYPSKSERKRFRGNIAIHSIYRSALDGKIKVASEYFHLQMPGYHQDKEDEDLGDSAAAH